MKNNKTKTKVRYLLTTAIVFIIVMFLPNLMMGLLSGIGLLINLFNSSAGNKYDTFMTDVTQTTAFNDVFMVIYSLLCIVIFVCCKRFAGFSSASSEGDMDTNDTGGVTLAENWKYNPGRKLAACVILLPGMQFLTDYIFYGICLVKPSLITAYYNSFVETTSGNGIAALAILYSLVLSPISEEMIFRGIIGENLKRLTGHFWLANFIQAALFGVFHGNIVQGCYTFVMGLFFGLVYKKGGSLIYSILLHVLFNTASSFVMEPLMKLIPETAVADIVILAVTVVSVVLGILMLMVNVHGCTIGKKEDKKHLT